MQQVVSISPTPADFRVAEKAVKSRVEPSLFSVAGLGGAVAAVLIIGALVNLTKAEYPQGINSNLSVLGTLGVLIVGVAVSLAIIVVESARIRRRFYSRGSKLLRPYTLE